MSVYSCKIPLVYSCKVYTCNLLFFISEFFGSSNLKFTRWDFFLVKIFFIRNQIIVSNLISAAL